MGLISVDGENFLNSQDVNRYLRPLDLELAIELSAEAISIDMNLQCDKTCLYRYAYRVW